MNHPETFIIYEPSDAYIEGIQLHIPKEIVPQFKELINRALNTNADCHPALKEFGDLLIHGKVLQDYWLSRTDI